MNQAFRNLSDSEQKRILDAAFIEFTDTSYAFASTNDIVKRADISKGRLFYYFKNKQNLFEFLIQYALDYVKREYLAKTDIDETDFIKRFVAISMIKKHAFEQEPRLFQFLSYVYLHETSRMPKVLYDEMERYVDTVNKNLYKGIDSSKFRTDIDTSVTLKLLRYALEGYQQDLIEAFKHIDIKTEDLEKHYQDYYAFLDTLKKIYYQ